MVRTRSDLFAGVGPVLRTHDLVVGNLEAVCEGTDGELWTKKPRLRTDPATLGALRDLHMGVVTLAHNHVYDHLGSGFRTTRAALDEMGIAYIGAGGTEDEARRPHRFSHGGRSFCLLNYVTRDTNPKLPPDVDVKLNYLDVERATREITEARAVVDHVVVILHWGGVSEEADYPHPSQIEIAHRLVEAGAQLVVGHHPHTLQPDEQVGSGWVFYSLGNFCFADVVCDGKVWEIDRVRNARSIILSATFSDDGVSVESIPIRNVDHAIVLDDSFWSEVERSRKWFPLFRRPLFFRLHAMRVRYLDRVRFYFWGNDRTFWKQVRRLDPGKVLRFLKNT
ncbi:MAG: CapA family protein [Candidatus Eisenbacteria bacterium]